LETEGAGVGGCWKVRRRRKWKEQEVEQEEEGERGGKREGGQRLAQEQRFDKTKRFKIHLHVLLREIYCMY
jgi:hypothetical protein